MLVLHALIWFTFKSPVYTAQTNPGSTRLCSHGQKPITRVNTNLGRARVNFSPVCQLVDVRVEHDHKTHECACAKSKLTRVRPRLVFTRHFSNLTRVRPGSKPNSGGGLDLIRVEPGLAAFIRQKLTRVSFNPGRTRVSLCRVNRDLETN